MPENIDTDENFFNIGWFSSKKMTLYSAEEAENDFLPWKPNTLKGVWVFCGTKSTEHSRSIYNVLNFLGDVGGLREAFKTIFGVAIGLYNQASLATFLLKSIFFKKPVQ